MQIFTLCIVLTEKRITISDKVYCIKWKVKKSLNLLYLEDLASLLKAENSYGQCEIVVIDMVAMCNFQEQHGTSYL